MEKDDELIKRHSAGATVSPETPFGELSILRNDQPLDQDFLKKWVMPFYMGILNPVVDIRVQFKAIKPQISEDVILRLLGDFNWRTRSTGAYFAGALGLEDKVELIGNLLLKSEVCYAGEAYSSVLACLNSEAAIGYFEKYLDYYLTRPDYFFEQDFVLAGLKFLTENNKAYDISHFLEMHASYKKQQNREPDFESDSERFLRKIKVIEDIRSF